MKPADVLKTIKDAQVKFVDLRFCDTKGKEQHVTLPSHQIDDKFFEDGKMFDGSSIAGWKHINESDMILMPDAATAIMDPFFDDKTLVIRCDVIEPATMQGYERDPRSVAKRAETYLKSTGIGTYQLFQETYHRQTYTDVHVGGKKKDYDWRVTGMHRAMEAGEHFGKLVLRVAGS